MFIDCPTIGTWFLNNRNFKLFLTNTNVTSRCLNTSWSIFIEQLVNTFVKWYRKSGITIAWVVWQVNKWTKIWTRTMYTCVCAIVNINFHIFHLKMKTNKNYYYYFWLKSNSICYDISLFFFMSRPPLSLE